MKALKILALFFTLFLGLTELEGATMIVGVAGGTGSGKSTLAHRLKAELGDCAIVISEDSYYRDQQNLSLEQRQQTNYDHPQSIEFDLLHKHLKALSEGGPVDIPQYCFVTHLRKAESSHIEPASIIIVEGILLFAVPELQELFDLKVFVDTKEDVRALRRVERDMNERGRSFTSVKDQYLRTVKPMHEQFVEPSKWTADVIIPVGGHNPRAVSLIQSYLSAQASFSSSLAKSSHD